MSSPNKKLFYLAYQRIKRRPHLLNMNSWGDNGCGTPRCFAGEVSHILGIEIPERIRNKQPWKREIADRLGLDKWAHLFYVEHWLGGAIGYSLLSQKEKVEALRQQIHRLTGYDPEDNPFAEELTKEQLFLEVVE